MSKENNEHHEHHEHEITIIFRINGEDVRVEVNENSLLLSAISKALAESGNTSRPPEEWGAYRQGSPLDPKAKIEELGLRDGELIELTLKVAAGG
ncbi:MAG: DUF2604 domain-containing protein [Deltaproteobacteria bacterium]|nr:DUF2604 domain-containing protein [Deltaproteobacteria bacterium]